MLCSQSETPPGRGVGVRSSRPRVSRSTGRLSSFYVILLLAGLTGQLPLSANPTVPAVTQGAASVTGSGTSQLTVNQSTPFAFINWNSFNINAGETTTFQQPSASSVTWNQINDTSASAINGTLNANGYLVLQNPNGFSVGGFGRHQCS